MTYVRKLSSEVLKTAKNPPKRAISKEFSEIASDALSTTVHQGDGGDGWVRGRGVRPTLGAGAVRRFDKVAI